MSPEGQPVCAVADGVVEFVREDERGQTDRHADDNKIVLHHDDKKFMTATVSDVEVLEKLEDKEFKLDD